MISSAATLAYARESSKIVYSICISGAYGVKEQPLRSGCITEIHLGLLKISESFLNA